MHELFCLSIHSDLHFYTLSSWLTFLWPKPKESLNQKSQIQNRPCWAVKVGRWAKFRFISSLPKCLLTFTSDIILRKTQAMSTVTRVACDCYDADCMLF
jgi:hypothetical protein